MLSVSIARAMRVPPPKPPIILVARNSARSASPPTRESVTRHKRSRKTKASTRKSAPTKPCKNARYKSQYSRIEPDTSTSATRRGGRRGRRRRNKVSNSPPRLKFARIVRGKCKRVPRRDGALRRNARNRIARAKARAACAARRASAGASERKSARRNAPARAARAGIGAAQLSDSTAATAASPPAIGAPAAPSRDGESSRQIRRAAEDKSNVEFFLSRASFRPSQ